MNSSNHEHSGNSSTPSQAKGQDLSEETEQSSSPKSRPLRDSIETVRGTYQPYRARILVTCLLSSLYTILEGALLACLIPAFDFITADSKGPSELSTWLSAGFSRLGIPWSFTNVFILILSLCFLRSLLKVISDWYMYGVLAAWQVKTKQKLFEGLMLARWPYLLRQKMGHLLNTLTVEIAKGRELVRGVINLYNLAFAIITYTVLAAWLSPLVTLGAVVTGASFIIGFAPIYRASRQAGVDNLKVQQSLGQKMSEFLLAFKVVKSNTAEATATTQVGQLNEILRQIIIRQGLLKSLVAPVMEPLLVLFVIGYIYTLQVFWTISLSEAAVSGMLIFRIYQRFTALQSSLNNLIQNVASIQRIDDLQREVREEAEPNLGKQVAGFQSLELEDVSFQHEPGRNILQDLQLEVQRGEFLGVVGESGAGKSTLIDLLLALIRPSQGRVLLNGEDLSDYDLRSWRNHVGYVGQDILLFNASVYENITLFDSSVSRESVERAAMAAEAHGFISELSNGYDTLIGDRGLWLSGGQRQRLALARALSRHPEMLLLDEATSALDSSSEEAIRKAITGLRDQMTIVSVAHRLSSVMDADRIVVLEAGRLTQAGSPEKLLAEGGTFKRLYEVQTGKAV